jgi:membrane-anchored mycosin MYCP
MRAKAAASAVAAAALLAANVMAAPAAMAIAPPVIDPGALPPAETPGPTEEMRQSEECINPVVIADPDVAQPAPGNTMLNIKQAWQHSTGAGVTVAIVDTGVTPSPRFPALFPGGDYVMGLRDGGLTDCENHGTVVASIIGASPSDPADRPPRKPALAQAEAPPPPVPANPAPTSAPPPPPPAAEPPAAE